MIEITDSQQVFGALLVGGFIAMALEIYVPGGVLGFFGALALMGAIAAGFVAFPGYGMLVAAAIVALGIIGFIFWMRIAPHTWIGRQLTISKPVLRQSRKIQ